MATSKEYTISRKVSDTEEEEVKVPSSAVSGLATVATSGSYNDLADKPSIPDISGKANLDGGNSWTGNQQFNQGGYWFATDTNHPFVVELENGDELVKVNPNGVSFDSDGLGTMPLRLNGNAGTSGQVLTSQGTGTTPVWSDVSYDKITGTPDLSVYQTKTDNALETDNKTVVGAINEVKSTADANADYISNVKSGHEKVPVANRVLMQLGINAKSPLGTHRIPYDGSETYELVFNYDYFVGNAGISVMDIDLKDTGVTADTYNNVTVDSKGRVTAGESKDYALKSDVPAKVTSVDGLGGGTINGNVSTTGNLTVGGNLTVNGTTTTVDSTTLQVKDKLIEVAHGNTTKLTTPAGLVAPKYDGTNSGALVFDGDGTAYVGDVTLDSAGNIDVSKSGLQPLATRTGLVGGNLVQYDSTAQTLKDSGKKIGDLATTSAVNAKYTKPSGGIPKTDLASDVQTSLSKADSALQSHQDVSGKANLAGGNTFSGTQVINGFLDIRGSAADKHLKTCGIGGSDGNGESSDLYLQYSSDFKTVFGKTGNSSLNADGSVTIGGKQAATTDQIPDISGKQDTLSDAQIAAANSGITAAKVKAYDAYKSEIDKKANSADLAEVATSGSYNSLTDKPTIPPAVTSINGLGGGELTSPLVISGGDQATAHKIALNQEGNGQITDSATSTIFGFMSNSQLTVGGKSYSLDLRGSGTRPTYKGADMALKSDIPDVSGKLTGTKFVNASGATPSFDTYLPYSEAQGMHNTSPVYLLSFIKDSAGNGLTYTSTLEALNATNAFKTYTATSLYPSQCLTNGFYYVNTNPSGNASDAANETNPAHVNYNPFLQYHTSDHDFRILTTAYSSVWLQQIATDFRSDHVYIRRCQSGTWQPWKEIAKTSDIPTVNNGRLTIQKNGTTVATFNANQSGNATANITVPTMTLSGTTLYITL